MLPNSVPDMPVEIEPGQAAECRHKAGNTQIGELFLAEAAEGKIDDQDHAKPAREENLRQDKSRSEPDIVKENVIVSHP